MSPESLTLLLGFLERHPVLSTFWLVLLVVCVAFLADGNPLLLVRVNRQSACDHTRSTACTDTRCSDHKQSES